ncbi:thiamine transporter 1-like [Chironomus tepperi]|uniref:thiamine transporter 1-like n=1 Tax=Chironomus tepperi TaxID=113505 RepID=UPI00391FBBB5
MREFLKISLILSLLGFLKEMRFIEPFLTDYYSTNFENVTIEIINQEIFPVGTYSHVIQLLIVFLITDYLKYKPLVILLGVSSAIVWGLMMIVDGKFGLQIIEVFYGTFCACEIAYYAYIYTKIDKENYQIVTSHTRSAVLFGRFFSALSAQILVYYKVSDYRQLNLLTFIFQVFAAIWSIFLIPSVKTSIYFHRDEIEKQHKKLNAFKLIWEHFKMSYKNETVLLWSAFYAMSFCLYFQITAYIQVLWLTIDDNVIWNASVDGVLTLLSAFSMLIAGKVHIAYLQQRTPTILILILICIFKGVLLIFAATSSSLLLCYILYVTYGILYAFSITICAFKIAENITEDSHGLIFGFNTFIGLSIQTCLTITIVSNGFKLGPIGQYVTYGSLYLVLGSGYLIKLLMEMLKK